MCPVIVMVDPEPMLAQYHHPQDNGVVDVYAFADMMLSFEDPTDFFVKRRE